MSLPIPLCTSDKHDFKNETTDATFVRTLFAYKREHSNCVPVRSLGNVVSISDTG
jgi:hypothetical protein